MGRWTHRQYKGKTFNKKTYRMIRWAEKRSGVDFNIAQGSFNKGGVSKSAGTHDGSALDVGMWGVSRKDRIRAVRALKDAGFAAWFRSAKDGWDPHIHAIPFNDKHVSPSAKNQLRDYDNRKDGLFYSQADNTYRPKVRRRWGWFRNRPVRRR